TLPSFGRDIGQTAVDALDTAALNLTGSLQSFNTNLLVRFPILFYHLRLLILLLADTLNHLGHKGAVGAQHSQHLLSAGECLPLVGLLIGFETGLQSTVAHATG